VSEVSMHAATALPDHALHATPDVPGTFAAVLAQAFAGRRGPRFALVLSGGPTARACYERVAADPGGIEWGLVDVYIGDERLVPPEDDEANQRLIREALIDPVGGVGSFTPMPTEDDMDECAETYQHTVARVLAHGGFDFIHLGMGPDGHTASLFPGAASLDAGPTTYVVGTEDPNGVIALPRLTFTLPAIAGSHLAVFTVAGASKRAAVQALRSGQDLPAGRVTAGSVQWLIDPDAFGEGPAS
jgi:6-phosphogluconolactonase